MAGRGRTAAATSIRSRASRRKAVAGAMTAVVSAVAAAVAISACGQATTASGRQTPPGQLPQGAQPVRLDPANFTTKIDNPYFPMRPGDRWMYSDTDRGVRHRVVVTVTPRTKVIAGVTARVVHDTESQGSELVEDTFDWYAQDRAGNVWYLGEATQSYDDKGRPRSTRGSWEAGKAGAQPGIIMPAEPRAGVQYRQEYRKGVAEDAARVLSVDEQAQARTSHYDNVLLTKEFTPVEPRDLEYKLYAKGVGLVLAFGVSGDSSRQELLRYRKGGG
jgi:hypothetical protein